MSELRHQFKPRDPREFVGTYVPRIDGAAKAAGRAGYLSDVAVNFQGLLHARVLRSPYPHARIKSMDTSAAEALPGVHCVLTYADPEVASLKPTNACWTGINTANYSQMYYPNIRDRRVLSDHVTWFGDDAGAVVAAETDELADQALELIHVEWEPLPFALSAHDSLDPDAVRIHPEINATSNVLPPVSGQEEEGHEPGQMDEWYGYLSNQGDVYYEHGDLEAGFAKAELEFEVATRHHRMDHACLDTRGSLAMWTGDKLTCWTNLYQSDQTRMMIAEMLDMPLNKVRVICTYAGGSFGRGNVGDQPFLIYTALLAKRTRRPVLLKYTRREDFHDTRNPIDYLWHVGANCDGQITAVHMRGLNDSGGYVGHGVAALKLVPPWDMVETLLPKLPALRMEGHSVYTNVIPNGCMRGIGNVQLNLPLGVMVDTLGETLGLDPIDIALKNFSHQWEDPPNESLAAVLRAGAEQIGWRDRHPAGEGPVSDRGKRRGMGFSFHAAWHAAWQEIPRGPVQVGVRLNPDGSVILQAPQCETGVGSNTCAVLACAEALSFLGVTADDIEWIENTDTETGLKDMVQTDSSVAYQFAEVMHLAADDLRGQICAAAARQLGVSQEEVDVVDGRIIVGGTDSGQTVSTVITARYNVPLHVVATGEMPEEKTGVPFLASFVEVEVDTRTGAVDVLRVVQVNDAGTVMFPPGAEAQQIGAQVMALGEALFEETVYDRATGVPLTFDWVNYTFPTMLDMPDVEPVLLEVWRGAGEYGACGIGENAITCTASAVLNAIHNAIGVRVNDIPIRPAKVLSALSRKESGLPGLDAVLKEEIRGLVDAARAAAAADAAAMKPGPKATVSSDPREEKS